MDYIKTPTSETHVWDRCPLGLPGIKTVAHVGSPDAGMAFAP